MSDEERVVVDGEVFTDPVAIEALRRAGVAPRPKKGVTITEFLTARLNEVASRVDDSMYRSERAYLRADIAAKRAIVAEYASRDGDADLMLGPDCLRQREWSGLRVAVRHLASVDSDHPDYNPDWSAA